MSLIWTASRRLALTIALAPLRLVFAVGVLLMFGGVIVAPLWGVQAVISLLGGGDGGGRLPAWEMTLLLLAAIPAGFLLTWVSGSTRRAGREERRDPLGHERQQNEIDDSPRADDAGPKESHKPESPDRDSVDRAYLALELEPDASVEEIKAAYRRLAHLYHPDHNPGFTRQAAQRFADIQAAYQTLTEARCEHC